MLKARIGVVMLLSCTLLGGTPAVADILVESTYMDYRGIDPDPAFDWDASPIWFTQGGTPYLAPTGLNTAAWLFTGQQEFSPDFPSGATDSTWFLKTGAEEIMEVEKLIVNNTGSAFTGYDITLHVATLVDGSLDLDGTGFDATINTVTDAYGNVTTSISIVFDTPLASGESFNLAYILDLSGIAPPPPPDGGFGVDEGATMPEPAAKVLLVAGAAALLFRRRLRA